MNISFCLALVLCAGIVNAVGYGSQENSNSRSDGYGGSSGGYGSQETSSGYGSERSNGGYGGNDDKGDQSGDIEYNLKYEINLPENEHGASADWMVEQDNNNAHYNLQQTHPYGAKSNVYFSMQNDH